MTPNFDPDFMRFCYWLSFIALVNLVWTPPVICFLLYRISQKGNDERMEFLREKNRIADELQKLRLSLDATQNNSHRENVIR
jgi:hypothetical protein